MLWGKMFTQQRVFNGILEEEYEPTHCKNETHSQYYLNTIYGVKTFFLKLIIQNLYKTYSYQILTNH